MKTTVSVFDVNASGTATLSLFFDPLALTQPGTYIIQAISQGVASNLSDSPLIHIVMSNGDSCEKVRGLSDLVDTSGARFLRNAAWVFFVMAVPLIYLNREEVSMRSFALFPTALTEFKEHL